MAIHPTAQICQGASIAPDAEIGAFTIIYQNVVIEPETVIGSHCEIGVPTPLGDGSPLQISSRSTIRSHSVFYESSTFGKGLSTGHRVTVREKTKAGIGFQIGTLGDIQGHCEIGSFVKFHSNVHVGQHSIIEDFVWIFPYVVLTNDPHPPSEVKHGVTVKRFAAIATMSVLLPGVTVGEGALVGASSCVTKDVDPNRIVSGNPASDKGSTERIKLKGTGLPAYPWRRHFHRGYPDDIVARWKAEFPEQ